MTVLVESKQVKVTKALREFATKQANKLNKLGKKISKVTVYLETITKKSNDPQANKVTFTLEVPGKNVVVRKHAVDMYVAIVDAAHAAVRQLRKKVERQHALRRRTASA